MPGSRVSAVSGKDRAAKASSLDAKQKTKVKQEVALNTASEDLARTQAELGLPSRLLPPGHDEHGGDQPDHNPCCCCYAVGDISTASLPMDTAALARVAPMAEAVEQRDRKRVV